MKRLAVAASPAIGSRDHNRAGSGAEVRACARLAASCTRVSRGRKEQRNGDARGRDGPDGDRRPDVPVLRHRRHGDAQERGLRAGHRVGAAGAPPALGHEARRRRGAGVLRRADRGRESTSTTSRSGRSATTGSSRPTAGTARSRARTTSSRPAASTRSATARSRTSRSTPPTSTESTTSSGRRTRSSRIPDRLA